MDINNQNNMNEFTEAPAEPVTETVEATPVEEVAPVAEENAEVVNAAPAKKTNGMEIASLICGIASVVLCLCSCVSFILGIVAVVLAIMSKKKNAEGKFSGMVLAGLICGIIGIVSGGIALAFGGVGAFVGVMESM